MKVRYTSGAIDDLAAIVAYIRTCDPLAAAEVGTAIQNAIKILERYPLAGHRQDMPSVRKAVVPRFGYLVYYAVNEPSDVIDILTILHPSRQRPFHDG